MPGGIHAELHIGGVSWAAEEIGGERSVRILQLARQLLILGRLVGDVLPDADVGSPLVQVLIVNPVQAEQAVRATAGRRLYRRIQFVTKEILVLELFARAIGPREVGAQVLSNDD